MRPSRTADVLCASCFLIAISRYFLFVTWLLLAVSLSTTLAEAAPVTLQFEATVGPPRQGVLGTVPPDWNMSLQQGDAISGTFTFEPFDAASSVSATTLAQPFEFSLRIKTHTLTTAQYGIEVFNDRISDDAPDPTDIINTGCSFLGGGTECAPATVSPGDPVEWSFGIAMFGGATVLDGADIPSNPLTWQQLVSDNTTLVSFRHPVTGWSYGFLATIDSIHDVPEPSSSVQIVLCAIIVFVCFLGRYIR